MYFISWGSGQSVLYSYLSIPAVLTFGLSRFSVRLLSIVVGILTLPLMYVTSRRTLGKHAAMLTTLLLAVMPWHIMISRWALDANLLPFFLLLGTYTVARALEQTSARSITAFLPWALGLYTYATAYVTVPILLIGTAWFYRTTLVKHWRVWAMAFGLFGVLSFPIGLFLFKNFVWTDWPIDQFLGLGIPRIPFSRLAQISAPLPDRWINNFFIIVNGFQDHELVNTIPGIPLIFLAVLSLSLVGAVYLLQHRRSTNLFLLWFGACVPLFFPWKLTSTHINAIYIPMLAIAAWGFLKLRQALGSPRARQIFVGGLAGICVVHLLVFLSAYYFLYPKQPEVELAFDRGFDRAIYKGLEIAQPAEPILVTDRISLPYILVAFHTAYPSAQFQQEVQRAYENDAIQVYSIGRFYFGSDNLRDPHAPLTFVLAKWDNDPCTATQFFLETRLWKVGKCK